MKRYHAVSIVVIAAAIAALAACDIRAAEQSPAPTEIIDQFDCSGRTASFDSNLNVIINGVTYKYHYTDTYEDKTRISTFGTSPNRIYFLANPVTHDFALGIESDASKPPVMYACAPTKWIQIDE